MEQLCDRKQRLIFSFQPLNLKMPLSSPIRDVKNTTSEITGLGTSGHVYWGSACHWQHWNCEIGGVYMAWLEKSSHVYKFKKKTKTIFIEVSINQLKLFYVYMCFTYIYVCAPNQWTFCQPLYKSLKRIEFYISWNKTKHNIAPEFWWGCIKCVDLNNSFCSYFARFILKCFTFSRCRWSIMTLVLNLSISLIHCRYFGKELRTVHYPGIQKLCYNLLDEFHKCFNQSLYIFPV